MEKLIDAKFNWLIILAVILVAPLGLYFIYKYRSGWWQKTAVKAVVIIWTVIAVIGWIGYIVNPPSDTTSTVERELERTEIVAFSTERIDDDTLAKGKEQVIKEGVNGEKVVVYRILQENGKEKEEVLSERITKPPANEVIAVGTYVAPPASSQSSGSSGSSSSGGSSSSSGNSSNASGRCKDGTPATGDPSAKGRANSCYGHGGWDD